MDFILDHMDTIGVFAGAVLYVLKKHKALASARDWLCAHRAALKLVTDVLEDLSTEPGATAQDAKKAVAAGESTVDQKALQALHGVLEAMRAEREKRKANQSTP